MLPSRYIHSWALGSLGHEACQLSLLRIEIPICVYEYNTTVALDGSDGAVWLFDSATFEVHSVTGTGLPVQVGRRMGAHWGAGPVGRKNPENKLQPSSTKRCRSRSAFVAANCLPGPGHRQPRQASSAPAIPYLRTGSCGPCSALSPKHLQGIVLLYLSNAGALHSCAGVHAMASGVERVGGFVGRGGGERRRGGGRV
jgi:hypothetical protein